MKLQFSLKKLISQPIFLHTSLRLYYFKNQVRGMVLAENSLNCLYFINLENYNDLTTASLNDHFDENIYMSEPQIMRDIVINQIGFTPYKYYPEQKKLDIYKTVEINISETGDSNFDYYLPE